MKNEKQPHRLALKKRQKTGSIPLAKSKGLKKHFPLQKVQDKCKMHILTNECTLFVSLSLLAHAQIKVKAKELQLPLKKCMNAQDCSSG